MIIALLTAADTGNRMGQDIPKQFMHVENKPVIIHTMEAFQRHPSVDAIEESRERKRIADKKRGNESWMFR